ncbi:MAG: site-specific integrase [Desulfovibrio sp.]|nr:site-specific integrase [Desulfovibrio sp.]
MVYTVLRYTEVIDARWSEIDFDQALWTTPATRRKRPEDGGGMKCRIPHIVPLAPQVLDLFRQLRAFNFSNELVFPGRNTRSRPLSSVAIKNALRYMGYGKDQICSHGFRGTFSTLANEKKQEGGIDSDVIEKAMSHKGKDQIRESYNHAEYLEQRRRLMNIGAVYLDELKETAE